MDSVAHPIEELLAVQPGRLSDGAVLVALTQAEVLRRRVESLRLALVAEVDARGLPGELGATSAAALVRARLGVGPREANRMVRTASELARHPQVAESLAAGGLTPEAAQVTVAALDRLPGDVDNATRERARELLLEWAGDFDAEALSRLARRLVARITEEHTGRDTQAREEDRAYANRGLWLSQVGAGYVLRADLDLEVGATLAAMIHAGARPRTGPDGEADPRSAPQRRADALERILRAATSSDDLPVHGGLRPTITVLTDLDTLRRALTGRGGVLDDGATLSAGAIRRLACDADVLPAVLGARGELLDLGRTARLVSAGLRRALVVRDGGCAWPGCDRPPAWTDAHHVRHWAEGGPTSLDNCVLLCRRHHRLAHEERWTIRMAALGPEFVPPRWIDPLQRPRRNVRETAVHVPRSLERSLSPTTSAATSGGPAPAIRRQ